MKKLLLMLLFLSSPLQAEVFDINQFNLNSFKGKVVYLDFWASWCKPCQVSFPWMNSIKNKYPENDFIVVTINLDEKASAMQQFLGRVKADFDIYHDPTGVFAEKFKIEGMPTSYLIDKSGKLVKKHIGFYLKKTQQYEKEIEALL